MKTPLKEKIKELKWKLVGVFGKLFIDFIFFTTKNKATGYEKVKSIISSNNYIAACWHSRILIVSYYFRKVKAVVLVSSSKDGEIIARVLQRQGYKTIRGSTSKGGLRAMVQQIKLMKKDKIPGAIIPDGPRGPRFKAQPGIITLAKKTGYPIIPITYSAKKIKVFSSWDRFIIPFPFTKCRLEYGEPVYVPENISKDEADLYGRLLEKELCKITSKVDLYFGHHFE